MRIGTSQYTTLDVEGALNFGVCLLIVSSLILDSRELAQIFNDTRLPLDFRFWSWTCEFCIGSLSMGECIEHYVKIFWGAWC